PKRLGLFAYGTLTMDAVMKTLLDRVPPSQPTAAPGWRAAGLPGLPYPGLVRDASASAPGRVYHDLTAREWLVLDAFEDGAYDVAAVALADGQGQQRAVAYVWPAETPALASTWTPDAVDVAAYVSRCGAWRREWEAS
ncbi:hypothetical protein B0T26DRAFT_604615, partial [Lasiosphaeria miniovina]